MDTAVHEQELTAFRIHRVHSDRRYHEITGTHCVQDSSSAQGNKLPLICCERINIEKMSQPVRLCYTRVSI